MTKLRSHKWQDQYVAHLGSTFAVCQTCTQVRHQTESVFPTHCPGKPRAKKGAKRGTTVSKRRTGDGR